MTTYQDIFEKAFSDILKSRVEEWLTGKLAEQSIELTQTGKERFLDAVGTAELAQHEFEDDDFIFIDREPGDVTIEFTDEDRIRLEAQTDEILEKMPKTIRKLTKKVSKKIVEESKLQWLEDAQIRNAEMDSFKARLAYRWQDGLIPLNIMLEVSRELGEQIYDIHQEELDADKLNIKRDVLIALHQRALQIGAEIICLLEAGYPDGAMARWRTLHEVTVVADIIHDNDDDIATRFIDHNIVDARKAMRRYIETLPVSGYELIPQDEIDQMEADYASALEKHGSDFRNEYGWAAPLFPKQKNPRFADLVTLVERDVQKPFYKMASFNVHANARSLFFRHTNMTSHEGVISGASNAGLSDPGMHTAFALCQISALLVGDDTNVFDNLIAIETLRRLRDKAEIGFSKANEDLEQEDLELVEFTKNLDLKQFEI